MNSMKNRIERVNEWRIEKEQRDEGREKITIQ